MITIKRCTLLKLLYTAIVVEMIMNLDGSVPLTHVFVCDLIHLALFIFRSILTYLGKVFKLKFTFTVKT